MLPPHEGYETSVESGKEDEKMIWTKEVPSKPGKYITRYTDETTGRRRYGTLTIHLSGRYVFAFKGGNVRKGCKPPVYGPAEYSKRVEDVEW